MEISASFMVTLLTIIGVLVIIVSIISELTKNITLLSKIPNNIQVIVLSQIITLITYFAYISYSGDTIIWYYVVATIIIGFTVAYVVLFGWNKLIELYKRFRNIPISDITLNTSIDANSDKQDTQNDNQEASEMETPGIEASDTASPSNDAASTTDTII